MPSACCVPFCKGNYRNGPRVSVYRFPRDTSLEEQWVRAIKRENYTPSERSRVCELHFTPDDFKLETSYFDERSGSMLTAKLNVPRLKRDAIPSKLPDCSEYSSSLRHEMESPGNRTRPEEIALGSALAQNIPGDECHRISKMFSSAAELKDKLWCLDTSNWSVVQKHESLLICKIQQHPHPRIVQSVIIAGNCEIQVFINDIQVHHLGEYKIPSIITDTNDLDILLKNLQTIDTEEKECKQSSVVTLLQLVVSLLSLIQDESFKYFSVLRFINEQLHLMTKKLEYSADLLIFSSLFYNCSPHGYRFLHEKGFLILPSYSTIRRILIPNSFVPESENYFLLYIKNKFKMLEAQDKTVTLLVDEIHMQPQMDYDGETVVGATFNSTEPVTRAFVFMISSILSKFKDIVHLFSVKSMTAETLHNILKNVIVGLEEIGFHVICVVTDVNAINVQALSLFSDPPKLSIVYPHPIKSCRPLFFLFDSAHLLKCIRNNWLNQKDAQKTMKFPKFSWAGKYDDSNTDYAPFTTIQSLYALEENNILKKSYKLSKSISLSTLERQNIKYAEQIFNECVIQALLTFGETYCLAFYSNVAAYINIIYTWWTIMNVQMKEICTKTTFATPLTDNKTDEKIIFLENFYRWLDVWDKMDTKRGKLTDEMFAALKHNTYGIMEITSYCIQELKLNYILTAKFQTDKLNSRFGEHRQLAGGNFYISKRQVYECEKKLRVMSVPVHSLPIHDKQILLKYSDIDWNDIEEDFHDDTTKIDVSVSKSDIESCRHVLNVIVYLAGYCCFAIIKKIQCNDCRDIITLIDGEIPESQRYTERISKGSLRHPDVVTTNIVMYNYIVINKLVRNPNFHQLINQRIAATTITLRVLADDDVLFHEDVCASGHGTTQVAKNIVWAATNVILNSYCSIGKTCLLENEFANARKKIKIETLT